MSTPSAVDEWREFLGPRYRRFLGIGIGQAAVSALAGDGLTIPLLLTLGAHPAIATVIGVLPYSLSAAQLLVPRLLRRFDGNLRGVTLVILAIGETRGFILAGLTILSWLGALPPIAAIVAIGIVMTMGGAATTIGGANLLAWFGAILPDPERRFVAPRVMGLNLGLGAILLLPVALLVQVAQPTIGVLVYAIVFIVAGVAGIAELVVVSRLRRPGRVLVVESPVATNGPKPETPADRTVMSALAQPATAKPAIAEPAIAEPAHRPLERFLRSIMVAAFGAGFGPYLSIYAISVLGLPPAFAILLAALSSAASLIAATIVGGLLGRGSSSRTLRLSFLMRGGSMILGLLAFPQNPAAGLILCIVAILASAGAAAGTLSANERLMRLAPGPELLRAQGRFVAGTAVGITIGQLSNAAILAILPLGYTAFAILFAVSGLTRFFTAAQADVSPTWSSSTVAYRTKDLQDP